MKKDILLFISDQHSYAIQGNAGDKLVRTPNLDRLASEGTVFRNCTTPFPLCVPARMCMVSGQLASRCDVMSNSSVLNSARATFLHSLNITGYETVLCGRMHFIGADQRHGFERRIAGDLTPFYTNRPNTMKEERGVHANTAVGGRSCLTAIGAGNSPTLEYDRYVISNALSYLGEDHEKPQFFCVGTYAPHPPFVAPKELYDYYMDRIDCSDGTIGLEDDPYYNGVFRDRDPEVVKAVRAAYYGLVEFLDDEVGKVYDAFQDYLRRTGHEGVFIYVSDHGEHMGNRGMYGKNTFYEQSVHIPLLIAGSGVKKGCTIEGATSLLDIGPTICDIAGALIPSGQDGESLYRQATEGIDDPDRMVISELDGRINKKTGKFKYAQMVKCGNLKYTRYLMDGVWHDSMFNVQADPYEQMSVLSAHSDLATRMKKILDEKCLSLSRIQENAEQEMLNLEITMKCNFDHPERWKAPECTRSYPEEMVCTKAEPTEFVFP